MVGFGLVDVIRAHPEAFRIDATPESTNTSTWQIRILPEVLHAFPFGVPEDSLEALAEADSGLPPRIERPLTAEESLQAFRIEVVHSLHRRGGTAALNDLGQEPRVNLYRPTIMGERKKLLEPIRVFGENFAVEDKGHGNFDLHLLSYDVSDVSMLSHYIHQATERSRFDAEKGEKGKGSVWYEKGKGWFIKGKGKCFGMDDFKGKGGGEWVWVQHEPAEIPLGIQARSRNLKGNGPPKPSMSPAMAAKGGLHAPTPRPSFAGSRGGIGGGAPEGFVGSIWANQGTTSGGGMRPAMWW